MVRLLVLLVVGSLLAIPGLLPGCAAVKPYERGTLAHPQMQLSGRLGGDYRPHMLSVREGSIGGESSAGAGCGCN